MVSGAMPMPAETSDTARLRRVSNQPVTVAIIGAKKALAARPTSTPKVSWNADSDPARLASVSAVPSNTAPHIVTPRAPQRSLAAPQPNEPNAITRKLMVIANEMPARDQPVSSDMGVRNTASENIAPMATQPMRPPSATMTQRYAGALISPRPVRARVDRSRRWNPDRPGR